MSIIPQVYEKTIVHSVTFDRMVQAAKGQLQPILQPRPKK
jgi:hypothetical protein